MKKLALITGASSGIGAELARYHARRDGNLILVARSQDKLACLKQELEDQHGVEVMVIVKDLTQPHAPQEIFEEVSRRAMVVDYLINNAGFGGHGKFHERRWEEDFSMIQLNITALCALTRLFLPDFIHRNSGKILNVSSTASLVPGGPLQAVYFATKSFVTSFSYALAEELHNTNITVTTLMPGATATEFARVAGMEKTALFKQAYHAADVAKDGYEGLLQGKLAVVTGVNVLQRITLGMASWMPKKMILQQVRRMQELPKA